MPSPFPTTSQVQQWLVESLHYVAVTGQFQQTLCDVLWQRATPQWKCMPWVRWSGKDPCKESAISRVLSAKHTGHCAVEESLGLNSLAARLPASFT